MNKLNEKIKKSLSNKKIKPRWYFTAIIILKDAGLVLLLVAAILSLGIITYIITQNNPWEFLPSGFKFFARGLSALPWELIGLLVLIIIAIYFLIKKVHFFYRLNNLIIISAIMFITLGGYFIADAAGLNKKIFNSAPIRPFHKNQGKFLFPNRGPRIWGEIKDIKNSKIIVEDERGKEWNVEYSGNTQFYQTDDLEIGDNVTIVGEKKDGNVNAYGIKETDDSRQRIKGQKSGPKR